MHGPGVGGADLRQRGPVAVGDLLDLCDVRALGEPGAESVAQADRNGFVRLEGTQEGLGGHLQRPGLAPVVVDEMLAMLKNLAAEGAISGLLIEQNLGVVQALAQHVVVLDQGRVVHTGAAAELLGNPLLLRQLLGVSRAARH